MSSSTAIHAATSQGPHVRRWLLAFFAPTYVLVAMVLYVTAFSIRDQSGEGPGGLMMALFGIANVASLWFCLREVLRVQHPAWQRPLLIVATIFGLAAQTVVAGLLFGLLFVHN